MLATLVAGCTSIAPVPVRHAGPRQFLLLPVEVNGVPATLQFDTGTSHTVISSEFADRVGIDRAALALEVSVAGSAPGATRTGQVADLKSFRVGSVKAQREPGQVVIVDMPSFRPQSGEDVAGMLGNATWASADYVLDAGTPSLGISRRLRLGGTAGAMPLRVSGNRTYLPMEINGRSFEFLLDTGSSATRVTQQFIDELKPMNADSVVVEITTAGSIEYKQFPALHAEVRLGQVRVPEFTILVGQENVIGLNLLRLGVLSVSTREGLFVFRSREGP